MDVTVVQDPEIVTVTGTDDHAASESSHFDEEVLSTFGADEATEKDPVSAKIVSWDEKKHSRICSRGSGGESWRCVFQTRHL